VVADADRHDAAIVAYVEEGLPWALLHLAGEIGQYIEPIDVYLERLVPGFIASQELLAHIGVTRNCEQRRQHVLVGNDAVEGRARLDLAGPAHEARNAPGAFPV